MIKITAAVESQHDQKRKRRRGWVVRNVYTTVRFGTSDFTAAIIRKNHADGYRSGRILDLQAVWVDEKERDVCGN